MWVHWDRNLHHLRKEDIIGVLFKYVIETPVSNLSRKRSHSARDIPSVNFIGKHNPEIHLVKEIEYRG